MALSDRVDGWKSIAAYFGRDRTTVVRWAKERALPVKRIPGGKKATVYALKSELDAWASAHADDVSQPTELHTPALQARGSKTLRWRMAGLALIGVVTAAFIYVDRAPSVAVSARPLPTDTAAAALYLQARDRWAGRSAAQLRASITDLKEVVRREPDFAPAHAALADAYLLAREYGELRDREGFPAARVAASLALSIDPNLDAAHRAMGFIQYWYDHDPLAAQRSFDRALSINPNQSQTHLWYGNILSDNGAHSAAIRHLNKARLLDPGAVEIQTYLGWSLWAAGRRDEAVKLLTQIAAIHPKFAAVHDCLSVIHLSEGDFQGYADGVSRRAALRENLILQTYSKAVRDRVSASDERGLRDVMFRHATQLAAAPGGEDHVWSAYNASLANDRDRLIFAISQAEALQEHWGSAGYVDRILAQWKDDTDIVTRIEQLRAPRIQ